MERKTSNTSIKKPMKQNSEIHQPIFLNPYSLKNSKKSKSSWAKKSPKGHLLNNGLACKSP